MTPRQRVFTLHMASLVSSVVLCCTSTTQVGSTTADDAHISETEEVETNDSGGDEVHVHDEQEYLLEGNEADAIAAWESCWNNLLEPTLERDRPQAATFWGGVVNSPDSHQRFARTSCRGAHQSLQDAWGRDDNTAYGNVENLDQEGDCWVVTISLGFETLVAYLDPESGDLLFAWAIPEG